MGALAEVPLAKRAQHVPIAVQDNERMGAAIEHIHVVFGIDRDTGRVDEFPAGGELLPIFNRLEEQVTTTYGQAHAFLLCGMPHIWGVANSTLLPAGSRK